MFFLRILLLNTITFTHGASTVFMTITLQHIIPLPLRDKLPNRPSDIWNRTVAFSNADWVKVKAPSGSGKTTLVHILWNLRKDFSGTVQYNQQYTSQLSAEDLAIIRQQHLSVIFQDLRLFGQLTALENIELKRQMVRKPYCDLQRVKQMAEALGVASILQQPAATCSYGEQQRIAIIRALVQPFELLIMDEPFSHLDNANAQRAADLISAECTQRGAGLLVTDLEEDHLFAYNKHLHL
jgi:putative ABC transport system ATP-binding protein